MIPGSKGHTFHARMKKYDFGTRKKTFPKISTQTNKPNAFHALGLPVCVKGEFFRNC